MNKWMVVITCLLVGCHHGTQPLPAFEYHGELQVVWQEKIGTLGRARMVQLQPWVVGDRIYVVDTKGHLRVLSLEHGDLKLDKRLPITDVSAVSGEGDSLLVVASSGHLIKLDTQRARMIWQQALDLEIVARPVVVEPYVVVQSTDGTLLTLDLDTGQVIWRHRVPMPALAMRSASPPLVVDHQVITGTASGQVVALELSSGRPLWTHSMPRSAGRSDIERMADLAGPLAEHGDRVFAVNYHGQLVALDKASGQPLWSQPLSSYTGVVVLGHSVIVLDDAGTLWSFDTDKGHVEWQQDGLRERALSSPVVLGQHILLADEQGSAHLLCPDTGQIVASKKLGRHGFYAPPLVVQDQAYLVSARGKLHALRFREG